MSAIEITGIEDIEAALNRLTIYAEETVFQEALTEEAQGMVQVAKGLVPEKTGRLSQAIKVRKGKKGRGRVSILASVGKRSFKDGVFYGAFQEFGWKAGARKSKKRSQQPGEHFMEYAFEQVAPGALQRIMQAIWRGAERILNK